MGLFDLFGKKENENISKEVGLRLGTGEIPEEEKKLFEAQQHEFLVLMGGGANGASRFGESKDYSVSAPILGYIDLTSGKHSGTRASLSYVVTEKEYDRRPYFCTFEKEKTYRIKGYAAKLTDEGPEYINNPYRLGGIYAIEVFEKNIKDEYLETLLAEFKKPVTYKSEILGELSLDRELGWIRGKIDWLGTDVEINVSVEDDLHDAEEGIKKLEEFCKNRKEWDKKVIAYATEHLIDNAIDWINSDNFEAEEIELTKEEFAERIRIESIEIYADGSFTIMFDDDGIFAGHVVAVEGNIENGPDSVYVEG